MKWHGFAFSRRNYYLFVSLFVIPVLVRVIEQHSVIPIVQFALFGVAGVIGETLVSVWWHAFFGQRLWVYAVDTVFHKYTSTLNFIPWGVGGFLYSSVVYRTSEFVQLPPAFSVALVATAALVAGVVIQLLLFAVFRPRGGKFRETTIATVSFVMLPVGLVLGALCVTFGLPALVLVIVFAFVATAAEYLFGKATQLLISKKMWTYTYFAYDGGHFTPLAIPLFALGGFYFWFVAHVLFVL
jgi:hypothetical protein